MKLAVALLLTAVAAHAGDGFETVRCGADVRGALVGKRISDEPAAAIEARHGALGLKDLGGDEITDELNSTSWRICAKEYVVVSDAHGVVRDALAFPAHSKAAPEFSASDCKANGKAVTGVVVGILDARGGEAMLPATAAWRIDAGTGTFTALPAKGLLCPRSAAIAADGGP